MKHPTARHTARIERMKYPISGDLGLRSLVIQQLFQTKLDTCIVAPVSPRHCPLEQGLVLVAYDLSKN